MGQIGLFEVEYLVTYLTGACSRDQDVRLRKMLLPRGWSLEVIENDTYVYPRDVVSGVLATAAGLGGWVAGWVAGCLSQPVLYQND